MAARKKAPKKAPRKPAKARKVAGHTVREHWQGDRLYEVVVRHRGNGIARWHQYIGSLEERRHVADYHLQRPDVEAVTIREV